MGKYTELITRALSELKERGGSSRVKLNNYLLSEQYAEHKLTKSGIAAGIMRGISSGIFLRNKQKIQLSPQTKVAEKKAAVKKEEKEQQTIDGKVKASKPKSKLSSSTKKATSKKAKMPTTNNTRPKKAVTTKAASKKASTKAASTKKKVASGKKATKPRRRTTKAKALSPQLNVFRLRSWAQLPVRSSAGAAGYDLFAAASGIILPGRRALVPTGIAVMVPEGTYGRIADRSGLALKKGLGVGGGVVDYDYTEGEVGVIIRNQGQYAYRVEIGDRIAQFIITEIQTPAVHEVFSTSSSERGANGFGSTGVNNQTIPAERTVVQREEKMSEQEINNIKMFHSTLDVPMLTDEETQEEVTKDAERNNANLTAIQAARDARDREEATNNNEEDNDDEEAADDDASAANDEEEAADEEAEEQEQ